MWQLLFFPIGFVICSLGEVDVETIAGEDVDLECLGTNTNDTIVLIVWKQSNGNILFNCDPSKPCEEKTTIHTLGKNDTFISSIVTIRNVSVVDEDEYDITMTFQADVYTCKINLTVNVPPKGLIMVEKAEGTILQNNGSITVTEGENKTLICKTSTQVKPAVKLKWVIPEELNALVDSQKYVNSDHGGRLLVPTRTVTFRPTYTDGDYIVLICKVASNSSFDHIQTSVLIINKGERTTNIKTLETSSKESHAMTTSMGTSGITTFEPSNPAANVVPWYKHNGFVIPGCSGVVMLLIVPAFVGGFFRSKKKNVLRSINVESTDIRPSQGRRSLPPTPSDHLPDQPPPTARFLRPVPSVPSDIPMRPLVPVSEDALKSPAERTCSRMTGKTFTTAAGSTALTQAQKELDTEMEYDLLNISHHGAPGAVPHVYRETTNGLAEYALVSRQQVDKRIDQRQRHRSKQMEDDSDYDLLNTWNQAEHGTVPHVYKETTSGLAEYAVVSKPDDKKKRQSLGPLTKVMKAPINVEAEYAVVDKSKKRAK